MLPAFKSSRTRGVIPHENVARPRSIKRSRLNIVVCMIDRRSEFSAPQRLVCPRWVDRYINDLDMARNCMIPVRWSPWSNGANRSDDVERFKWIIVPINEREQWSGWGALCENLSACRCECKCDENELSHEIMLAPPPHFDSQSFVKFFVTILLNVKFPLVILSRQACRAWSRLSAAYANSLRARTMMQNYQSMRGTLKHKEKLRVRSEPFPDQAVVEITAAEAATFLGAPRAKTELPERTIMQRRRFRTASPSETAETKTSTSCQLSTDSIHKDSSPLTT